MTPDALAALEEQLPLTASPQIHQVIAALRNAWLDRDTQRSDLARWREQHDAAAAQRDEARAWVRRLTSATRVLTCVYCGEAYPPGTPDHGADILTAHVRACAQHPMRAVEAERDAWKALARALRPFASERTAAVHRALRRARDALRVLGIDLATGEPLRSGSFGKET